VPYGLGSLSGAGVDGCSAAADLALHILRSDYGAGVANTVARQMVAPPYRRGGQAAD
jgi:AraC family transcriptional activator FtrA